MDVHRSSRARVLAAKEAEVDRCRLVQADVVYLQQELDRETERLATSLRERREEEEEHFLAEVGFAWTQYRAKLEGECSSFPARHKIETRCCRTSKRRHQ